MSLLVTRTAIQWRCHASAKGSGQTRRPVMYRYKLGKGSATLETQPHFRGLLGLLFQKGL